MATKSKKKVAKRESEEGKVEKTPPSRILSPFDEMDRMFENFFPRRWMQPFHWEMPHIPEMAKLKSPRVDVIDRETDIVVKAEIAGVNKEDIEVSITNNSVTIKGSTSHEEKEEKGDYYRCEISRGSFSRTVALPSDVNSDKAKAVYKDGILELTIPKASKSHRKTIDIE